MSFSYTELKQHTVFESRIVHAFFTQKLEKPKGAGTPFALTRVDTLMVNRLTDVSECPCSRYDPANVAELR